VYQTETIMALSLRKLAILSLRIHA
jgi:hypothetical protein